MCFEVRIEVFCRVGRWSRDNNTLGTCLRTRTVSIHSELIASEVLEELCKQVNCGIEVHISSRTRKAHVETDPGA
jgi:hypothetical protein